MKTTLGPNLMLTSGAYLLDKNLIYFNQIYNSAYYPDFNAVFGSF